MSNLFQVKIFELKLIRKKALNICFKAFISFTYNIISRLFNLIIAGFY